MHGPLHLRTFDRDERVKALLLGSWFFVIVATLWLLKSVRVASLVAHLGARETPYVVLASALAVGVAVAIYSFATARLSRIRIVQTTSAVFAFVLLSFAIALHVGGTQVAGSRAFIWLVYMLVDIFAVVMVELFWTYACDVLTQPEADRLFGAVGLGGILGGLCGGAFVDVFARTIGGATLLVIAAGAALGCAALGTLTERVLSPPGRRIERAPSFEGKSVLAGFNEVRKSRYLLLLVGVVVAYEFTATLTTYGTNVVFERANLTERELTGLYGRLGWIASAIAIVAQVLIVPAILPTKRIALLLPPIAMLASVLGVLVLPVLATAFVLGVVDHGLNYSVQQATR